MKKSTIYNAVLLCTVALMAASCSCSASKECKLVSQRGANDAVTLVERADAMSQMQLESYLLRVRANEYEYRREGKDDVADAYIEAFEMTLVEKSDSLASLILGDESAE